jgi:subtilisin family serine protease
MNLKFFNLNTDAPILVVADDESNAYDTNNPASLYKRLLSYLGYSNINYYYVDSNSNGPNPDILANYKLVLWEDGHAAQLTLTEYDQQSLEQYLDNGGNLYLSGNNLSYELSGTSFAAGYLHVNYLYNDDNRSELVGALGTDYQGQAYSINDIYSDMLMPSDEIGITALYYKGDEDYANSYQYLHGTSMAAPYASGIAALLLSKGIDDPKLLKSKIMLGAQPLYGLKGKVASEGMVNAYNSFTYIRDFNNDSFIDMIDLAAAASCYNISSSDNVWKQIYDINGDGVIDIFDLVLISKSMK